MIATSVHCRRFIGRRRELDFLVERRRDLSKGHGGIVLVRGDAGIGKSRLLREFLDATGHARGRVAVGRCRAFANGPYEALLEVLEAFEFRSGGIESRRFAERAALANRRCARREREPARLGRDRRRPSLGRSRDDCRAGAAGGTGVDEAAPDCRHLSRTRRARRPSAFRADRGTSAQQRRIGDRPRAAVAPRSDRLDRRRARGRGPAAGRRAPRRRLACRGQPVFHRGVTAQRARPNG